MHTVDVDGVAYKMHKFDIDGIMYYQFRSLFRLQEPDVHGVAYLVYIRRDKEMSGSTLLHMAETIAADKFAAKRISLQDAAHIHCSGNVEFDLGFRSMLSHGQTWYQLQGYHPIMDGRQVVSGDVECAVRVYAQLRVKPIIEALKLQITAMRNGLAWKPASRSLFTSSKSTEGYNKEKKTLSSMLRARLNLLKLLRTADSDVSLGAWLLQLNCNDYSRFMRSMYGTRDGPGASVEQTGGIVTPTLSEFKRANWLRRYSHRLYWFKDL